MAHACHVIVRAHAWTPPSKKLRRWRGPERLHEWVRVLNETRRELSRCLIFRQQPVKMFHLSAGSLGWEGSLWGQRWAQPESCGTEMSHHSAGSLVWVESGPNHFLHHNYILGECVNEMLVTLHVSTSTDNTRHHVSCVHRIWMTHELSTSLWNCAVYFMSACTKNVQETSLGHPLYVFCSAGNFTFCPVFCILYKYENFTCSYN